jgi:hypothetical protein
VSLEKIPKPRKKEKSRELSRREHWKEKQKEKLKLWCEKQRRKRRRRAAFIPFFLHSQPCSYACRDFENTEDLRPLFEDASWCKINFQTLQKATVIILKKSAVIFRNLINCSESYGPERIN